MDSLEALHATFESANDICLYQKLNADLRLCWFIDTLEVLPREIGRNLRDFGCSKNLVICVVC